jgi:hypothetical protein
MKTTRQHLAELYFKALAEKDAIKRTLIGSKYPTEEYLSEYVDINGLIGELQEVLGHAVISVP